MAKFGVEDRGWFSTGLMRCHGRILWKKIGEGKEKLMKCISWKVGRGNRLNFWTDNWLEGGSLMSQFPQIYLIAQNKEISICDCLDGVIGEEGEWQVVVTRNLSDWKVSVCGKLLGILSQISLKDEDDRPRWTLTKNGFLESNLGTGDWLRHLMRLCCSLACRFGK